MQSKPIIAAFDFDGTITTKDTLFDFIAFYIGKPRLLLGLIVLSPMLIFFKLGFIKNNEAKQKMFSFFFKSESIEKFNSVCEQYIQRVNIILKQDTIDRIKWHQSKGHKVVIISASIKNWIEPWAIQYGIDEVLATEILVKDKAVVGKFSTANCYGQEKVNRLLIKYPDRNGYVLYAYGDSRGDKELLELADYPILLTK